jgi:hypothetical protein
MRVFISRPFSADILLERGSYSIDLLHVKPHMHLHMHATARTYAHRYVHGRHEANTNAHSHTRTVVKFILVNTFILGTHHLYSLGKVRAGRV